MRRIYIITNKINNFKYVGKESGKKGNRWRMHIWYTKTDKKSALINAMREYGVENFEVEFVFESEYSELINKKEIELIKELNTHYKNGNGYNMVVGSQGGTRWKMEDCREIAIKYKTRTEWARKDPKSYDVAHYNDWVVYCASHMPIPKKYTEKEIRESASKYNHPHEWRKNDLGTYDSARSKGIYEDIIKSMKYNIIKTGKPIILNGVFYKNAYSASKQLNINNGNLNEVLIGKRLTINGMEARYATKDECVLNGLNTDSYEDNVFVNNSIKRNKLISGIPLIDDKGNIYKNFTEADKITGLKLSNISFYINKTGIYKNLKLASKEDIIHAGLNPLDWSCFFNEKHPGFLSRNRRPHPLSSTQN